MVDRISQLCLGGASASEDTDRPQIIDIVFAEHYFAGVIAGFLYVKPFFKCLHGIARLVVSHGITTSN